MRTIFGPNRSRRRELKFEKISNERANEQKNELYKFFWKFLIKNDNSNPGFVGIRGSRRNDRKNFEKKLYNSFVCSFARSFENFSNFSSRRRDRFGPKIVKFRAILAIFRPFEDFRNGAETKHLNSIRAAGPPKGPCSSNRIQML